MKIVVITIFVGSESAMRQYNTLLKYGFFGGLTGFGFKLLMLLFGQSIFSDLNWLGSWILPLFVFLGVKSYRDEEKEGFISFPEGMTAAMIVVIAQSVLVNSFVLFYELIFNFPMLNLGLRDIELMIEELKLNNEDTSQLELILYNFNVIIMSFTDFIFKLAGGFFVSLLIARLIKKNKPIFEE